MLVDVFQAVLTNVRIVIGNVANIIEVTGFVGGCVIFSGFITSFVFLVDYVVGYCSNFVLQLDVPHGEIYELVAYCCSFDLLGQLIKILAYIIGYGLGFFYSAILTVIVYDFITNICGKLYKFAKRGTGH